MKKKKLLVSAMAMSLAFSMTGCSFLDDLLHVNDNTENPVSVNTGSDSSDIWEDDDVEKKVNEINSLIDYYYYFDIDKETQEEALYDGIMMGLDDPYSVYYTQDEYEALMEENTGEYVGIGAVVTQDETMKVSIVRPVPGSPAEEVGLLAEDIFIEIDGTVLSDEDLQHVVDMIRGEEGTVAHIKIFRPSINEYLEFDVTRRVVENVTVYHEMLDDSIGYIQVQQFYENTPDEFIKAIETCQSQGAKALVIDMRDNPGGLLTAVVEMCDYIIEGGNIVSTRDKNGNNIAVYEANDSKSLDIPMAVLVNGNSASASEIFAGAMKDTKKADIIGTTTFGKGIVQSVIPLSDGTAIKITIAKYFTPNDNDIHEVGVEPDYVVELKDGRTNAVNLERADDVQLDKAVEVLKGKIK